MKIVVGGLHQESNSFSPVVSTRKTFVELRGEEILKIKDARATILSGILQAVEEAGGQVVPAVSYTAQSGGPVSKAFLDEFIAEMKTVIDAACPDGVFLDLHGGMEMEGHEDGGGYIVEQIRKITSAKTVITVGSDLHANVTDRMTENADFVSSFQTYPHTDYYETGYRSASQGLMKLSGKKIYQARIRIPMIVPAEGYNTNEGVFKELMDEGHKLVADGKLIDFTINQMQPWLNLHDAGSTVLVTAADKDDAAKYAKALAHKFFDLRKNWEIRLYTVDEVIDAAKRNETKAPVLLVDSADSPNAGSSGDSSCVLSRLLERGETLHVCMGVTDKAAADHAFEVGVGNEGDFSLGGTKEPRFQRATKVHAYVKALFDGDYCICSSQKNLQHSGKTAVLQIGNIDVIVYTKMGNSSDLQTFRAFGVDPAQYELAVVKSATQYKVNYSAFTKLFYPTDTPGSSSANLRALPFDLLQRPFYPFDDIDTFDDTVTFGRA